MTLPGRPPSKGRTVAAWAVVVALSVLLTWLLRLAHMPSPEMFGSLFGTMIYAVSGLGPTLRLPRWGSIGGQALLGASMGVLVQLGTLQALGGHALTIAAVNLGTLVASLAVGALFARWGHLAPATGTFSMIAGGASGIVSVARELGADERVTSVVQYLRVLLILVGMPVVAAVVFRPGHAGGAAASASAPLGPSLLLTAISLGVGLTLAGFVRFPASSLLMPLAVAGALSVSGALGPAGVPGPLLSLGYALIGMQVGLRFTRASLREVGRLLPLAVVLIVVIIAACAGIGLVLSAVIGVPPLDAYLATTPGGLYAVLATAADSGADVTFVLAVQVIRLILMLFSAPLIAAYYGRHHGTA